MFARFSIEDPAVRCRDVKASFGTIDNSAARCLLAEQARRESANGEQRENAHFCFHFSGGFVSLNYYVFANAHRDSVSLVSNSLIFSMTRCVMPASWRSLKSS